MANKQNAQLSDVIMRRNELLEKLFSDCQVPIRVIGNPQKPVFVYNEEAILSMYAKNFNLYFLSGPNGKVINEVKLRKQHGVDHSKFMSTILKAEHRAAIKIKHRSSDSCLQGYGYLDDDDRYPVFGPKEHNVYPNKKTAEKVVSKLNKDGYEAVVYIPALDNNDQLLNIKLYEK